MATSESMEVLHDLPLASSCAPGWIFTGDDLCCCSSLFQHLHRQLGLLPEPHGAGFDPSLEWRRDKEIPLSSKGSTCEFYQYYLDDFDAPEIVDGDGWEALVGQPGRMQQKQREAYERVGVARSIEKSQERATRVCRMGAEIDGLRGTMSAPLEKKLETAYFALWLMGQRLPPTKALLMVLGRLVRCFEFRRPHALRTVWPKGNLSVRRPMSWLSRQELLESVAVLPLAGTDLRAEVQGQVTCSDASLDGGGLCASGRLTEEGDAMLELLHSCPSGITEGHHFTAQGSMRVKHKNGLKIFVVSLFDGIAALMCALCKLEVQVVGFASSEVDKACKKLVRKRWPGVIELGDIAKI